MVHFYVAFRVQNISNVCEQNVRSLHLLEFRDWGVSLNSDIDLSGKIEMSAKSNEISS